MFGVYGHPEAANLAYLGLYGLQHRGQESAGIVSSNGKALIAHRGMGLVADIFNEDVLRNLEGTSAIGHNRYSTTGSTTLKNCQPLVVEYARGGIAIAHNGNLVNFAELRDAAGGQRLAVSVILGQRNRHPSDRGLACADGGRARHRGALAGQGRIFTMRADGA